MGKKRLSTGIPREWSPAAAEIIQAEFDRIYSQIVPVAVALADFPASLPYAVPYGDTAGGWVVLPFNSTPQRSLTNQSGVPAWAQVSLSLGVTGTLPATNGGTGTATVTVGDLLYGSAVNTWAKLAKDANATRYLSNTGASNIPAWAQINLANGVTGTLPATNGGTGTATVAVGDLLYGSAANVWSKLATDASATRYLSNTGAANIPAWAQINLANGVTGTLPVANGGTGLTTFAQGDLIYASATAVLSALAKDTSATRYLSNTGTTNNPAWAQVNLANGVTGTLPDGNLSANIPLINASLNNFTGNLRAAKIGIGVTPSASVFAVVGLPTSSAGLATGDVWVDTTGGLNILKIV